MQTSVQDWPGRVKLWSVGVPPSGPMDALGHRLANALVGNDEDAAALEFSLQGEGVRACINVANALHLAGASKTASLPSLSLSVLPRVRFPLAQSIALPFQPTPTSCHSIRPLSPHPGPTLKFHCPALVALAGAPFSASLDGEALTWNSSFAVAAGQVRSEPWHVPPSTSPAGHPPDPCHAGRRHNHKPSNPNPRP